MAEKTSEETVVKDGLTFRRTGMGLVFVPDFKTVNRKHNCPDCAECALCSDDRCRVCRKEKAEQAEKTGKAEKTG